MRVRTKNRKGYYYGRYPHPGDLFMSPQGTAIYLCVDPEIPCNSTSPVRITNAEDVTCGVNIENGRISMLQSETSRRTGFRLMEPEGGELIVTRKERS